MVPESITLVSLRIETVQLLLCVPHCDINECIRLGAMCFTDHSEKRFF